MFLQRFNLALLCTACLILGGVIGWLVPLNSPISPTTYRGALLRQSSVDYQYIAPLLACDVGSEEAFPEFAPLKEILTDLINKNIHASNVQNTSVYLRSLRSARWFEINGSQTYAPASLLKIFAMMAYYKEANETDNPGLLQKKILFKGSSSYGDDVVGGTIVHLVNGRFYTVDRIIDQMITYSDNDAYDTLLNNLDSQGAQMLATIFSDLTIPLPTTQDENSLDFMTADKYSMVFRVLFGSTYLSERYSEKALKLLSQAKYTDGIVAGVPSNLTVAHKYGIRAVPVVSAKNPDELHDCGIIYYPSHPYLLCVMTKGEDFLMQQAVIKNISATTYTWLDAFYKAMPPSMTASSTPKVITL